MEERELELPEPTWAMPERVAGKWKVPGAWSADAMRAYGAKRARQAVLAERENWHALMRKICDLSDIEMGDGDTARDLAAKALGFADYSAYCAAAIRKG